MIIPEADKLQLVSEYYFSTKLQQVADMRKAGKDIINLGIGSPDLAPSEATVEALYQSAKNPNNHGYQSYKATPELRAALAQWYKRTYGVELNPDNEILPLMGSKEGIMHISQSFVNPHDEVLIPNPGYPTYSAVSNLSGAKIRYYHLDEKNNWAVDINRLREQDLSKVKIMWINYPNMPTGAQPTDALFENLIELAHEQKFLLVNDNPYSLILNSNPQSILRIEGAKEVAIELNSLSKSHNMAGWRLGWVSGDKDYIKAILKFKSNMDSGMFLGLQHAAIEALNNSAEWHAQQNAEYQQRRNYAMEIFDLLNCQYDVKQVGLFVWAKAPENVPNVEEFVEDILQNAHIFITPGFIFGSNGERYLRISLCAKAKVFEEAIHRIKKHISKPIEI